MKSLLLDRTEWDIVLDADGNWAVGEAPYTITQDVACAVRTFKGECWYDTALGIPYFEQILGHWPPMPLVKELITKAALSVPGVVSAICVFAAVTNRELTGQIQITDTSGVTSNVDF